MVPHEHGSEYHKMHKMTREPTLERAEACKERAKYRILYQELQEWLEQDTEEKFARCVFEGRMPSHFTEKQAESALAIMFQSDLLDAMHATGQVERRLNDAGEFVYSLPKTS
jgi:hypothetical protein